MGGLLASYWRANFGKVSGRLLKGGELLRAGVPVVVLSYEFTGLVSRSFVGIWRPYETMCVYVCFLSQAFLSQMASGFLLVSIGATVVICCMSVQVALKLVSRTSSRACCSILHWSRRTRNTRLLLIHWRGFVTQWRLLLSHLTLMRSTTTISM